LAQADSPPRRRISAVFFLIASLIIWLTVIMPPAVLISWALDRSTGQVMLFSLVLAPLVGYVMWTTLQSARSPLKWPLMQLIGSNGILLSVVTFLSPLTLLLHKPLTAALALVVWIALCAHAVRRARHIREITLDFSHAAVDRPYTLVHASDLHAGSRSAKFIADAVQQINRHQPDGVLITGDLLDSSAVDREWLQALQGFQWPCWVSLGNHERYVQLADAVAAIEENGAQVLRNRAVQHGPFQIIGIDDADDSRQVANVLPQINLVDTATDGGAFRILMYHRPQGWSAARAAGIDLMLCGHTHAGQIWPFGLLVKRQFRKMAGCFHRDGSTLFVSQGTGTWGPTMRLGTHSEIAILKFQPDAGDGRDLST